MPLGLSNVEIQERNIQRIADSLEKIAVALEAIANSSKQIEIFFQLGKIASG